MDSIVTSLSTHAESQFMSQGMVLILFGGIMSLLRSVPIRTYSWVKRKLFASVELSEGKAAFSWINSWCAVHIQDSWMSRAYIGYFWQVSKIGKQDSVAARLEPAVGVRLFFHDRKIFIIHRSRIEKDYASNGAGCVERVTLYALKLKHITDLVEKAHALYTDTGQATYTVRVVEGKGWHIKHIPSRGLNSVILPQDLKLNIVADVKGFLDEESWYLERNLEYNRGFLLSGPPGTGKTSIVRALASDMNRPIYTFDLSSVVEATFTELMRYIPQGSIVLFEDIDAIYNGREYLPDFKDGTSFSTFINAIDGVTTPSGLIKIFTTNHIENLDPALLRPGRCDRIFEFGNADSDMAEALFLRIFPKNKEMAKIFSAKAGTGEFSMATLQEHLLRHKGSPEGAASSVPNLATKNPSVEVLSPSQAIPSSVAVGK